MLPTPTSAQGLFTGELFEHSGVHYRHRPLRVWLELAEQLGCRLHTPEPEGTFVKFTVSRLADAVLASDRKDSSSEAYGERVGVQPGAKARGTHLFIRLYKSFRTRCIKAGKPRAEFGRRPGAMN